MFINQMFINCGIIAAMPIDRTDLHRALDAGLEFSATYAAGNMRLSNHLPMMLTALWQLGAPADSLDAPLRRAQSRLERLASDSTEALTALELAARIERADVPTVLAEELPGLLLAAETAAFHGLIRLAYALAADHPGEIARALAAWRLARLNLGPPVDLQDAGQQPSIANALLALRQRAALETQPRPGTTITTDLQACTALPGFDSAVAGEDAPTDAAIALDSLAEASLAVYLASRDFTALHLVTACHAWRTVEPLARLNADQARIARRGLWRAWLAAWLSIGRPAPDFGAVHEGHASEASWQAALPALSASPDEHRVKLAWTALDEWRHRGWPGYARVLPAAQTQA